MICLIIAWLTFGLLLFSQNIVYIATLNKFDSFIVFILFLISGPFFTLAAIFEILISLFLPEGWNDDDDNDHGV